MRQFLLGNKVAYASSATDYTKVPAGAFAIFVIENGASVVDTDGSKVKDMANLVLGRDAKNGGPVVIPINKRGFHYSKGEYQPATEFSAQLTIPDATTVGTYSIMMVKKGKVFNDRHKWTADIYVKDIDETGASIATRLAKQINLNTVGSGIKAEAAGATLTLTAVNKGEDYNVVPCDELMGLEVTINTKGIPAYGDAAYVTDLACRAAADAGFEYTFEEDIKMYPNYPLDPLDMTKAEDSGFTIYSLVYYERREVKNLDHVTRQVTQIAVPTGAPCISTLDTIFNAIAETPKTGVSSEG